jgi:hypothetical protein
VDLIFYPLLSNLPDICYHLAPIDLPEFVSSAVLDPNRVVFPILYRVVFPILYRVVFPILYRVVFPINASLL